MDTFFCKNPDDEDRQPTEYEQQLETELKNVRRALAEAQQERDDARKALFDWWDRDGSCVCAPGWDSAEVHDPICTAVGKVIGHVLVPTKEPRNVVQEAVAEAVRAEREKCAQDICGLCNREATVERVANPMPAGIPRSHVRPAQTPAGSGGPSPRRPSGSPAADGPPHPPALSTARTRSTGRPA